MVDLRSETEAYVNDISEKMKLLSDKIADLKNLHDRRVVYIKTQIASTMSEYDNLLRSRPEIISDAEKQSELDLSERTRIFKEKMDALDRVHNEIVEELAQKRDETITKITNEINALEIDKPNKLKEYEDDIDAIVEAYDTMLKNEKDKQNELAVQLKKARSEQEKFIANMHNEELNASTDFEAEKERLAKMHEENLIESQQEFKRLSDSLKQQFDRLVSERKALGRTVGDLVNHYRSIDDEIAQDELRLKYECNAKLLDVRKLFEKEQNRKKEKLSMLDILNDQDVDIFK